MYLPVISLIISAITVLLESVRELRGFRIRRYEVSTSKAQKDVHILFLSDLHGKMYGERNCGLVRAVQKEKPDAILIGGDMLTRSQKETDECAVDLIRQLVKIAPVYLANGNHEQKMKENMTKYGQRYLRYRKAVLSLGVKMLENDSFETMWKGMPVTITGLEIPVSCYTHFKDVPLSQEEIESRIGMADLTRYQILLSHNPAYMKRYKEWGSELTLCGHLHGGIIRLPLFGGVITPQAKLFPRYSGDIYQEDGHCGVVSRGLGTHTVNLRYLNAAELVSIVIKPDLSK